MPCVSPAQKRLMEGVAHNPKFAKKVGISSRVGKEFVGKDEDGEDTMKCLADAIGAWRETNKNCFAGDAAFAFDKSAREIDQDGHMHVTRCVLTKGVVNPYKGSEIPDYKELGLQANTIYKLWRDPKELESGTATLQGKPLLLEHRPISADDHPARIVAGAIANPSFEEGTVYGDLVIWSQDAIDEVKDGSKRELSCGYRYVPIMSSGQTPDGDQFDGRMTQIQFNHVALVSEGRVSGAVVADSAEELQWSRIIQALEHFGL